MIDLYLWKNPYSLKVLFLLEELNIKYNAHIVDNENIPFEIKQYTPNDKLPVLIDHQPKANLDIVHLNESGAIMVYLSEKYGKLLPKTNDISRYSCFNWLSWESNDIARYAEKASHEQIYDCFNFLNQHLQKKKYLCDSTYSIADISLFVWIDKYSEFKVNINDFPHLKEWYYNVFDRRAIKQVKINLKNDSYLNYQHSTMGGVIANKENKTS